MLLKMLYARRRKLVKLLKKKVNKMDKTQISTKTLKLFIEIESIEIDLKETIKAIKAIEKYHIENAIGGQV